MILTVTPNPSLDLLFTADRLVWDDANRLPMPRRRPGGQGINVVRAARALEPECAAVAIAPLDGDVGGEMARILEGEGTPVLRVRGAGDTRVFVGVREVGTGRALLLNPRGPEVGADTRDRLMKAVLRELERESGGAPRWLACCGSLLPGLPADFYARVGSAARARGWSFVPDCDGDALRLAAAGGADLLVPNVHEAERLLGRAITGGAQARAAARALLDTGPGNGVARNGVAPRMAVITLAADGAVAATRDGCWVGRLDPPPELGVELEEGSAVGAGDAFLAALLSALIDGAGPPDALATAIAAGSATLLSRGADVVRPEDVERVRPHVRVEPAPG